MIVEIPFGLGDPKSSREHRSGEILRARLAIASSDREDFQCERPPVIGCQGTSQVVFVALAHITVIDLHL